MSALWMFLNLFGSAGLLVAVALICLAREAKESDGMMEQIRRYREREAVIVHMLKEGFPVARIAREVQVESATVKAIMQRMVLAHGHRSKPKG